VRLEVQPGEFAICRLDPGDAVPAWAEASLLATLRNELELSIVCADDAIPAEVLADRGWRLLRLAGTQDLTLTGVLARLLRPLAEAEVPIFAISSYDTDHVLVPGARLDDAVEALGAAGHEVADSR
jgi:uncharacterized protein